MLNIKNEKEFYEMKNELMEVARKLYSLSLEKRFKLEEFDINSYSPYESGKIYNFLIYGENFLKNIYEINKKEIAYIKSSLVIVGVFSVVLGIFFLFYFSRYIAEPVEKIRKLVKNKGKGIIDEEIIIKELRHTDYDELKMLELEFSFLINKIKKMKEELNEKNTKLAEEVRKKVKEIDEINKRVYHSKKLADIGRMTSLIAHEIKNPLNVVLNVLNSIKTDDRETLNIIREELLKINKLVCDFLDYARAEKYNFKNFDLVKTLENVISFWEAAHDDIKIEFSKNTENCDFYGDEEKIERLFLNLFTNSKQALESRKEKNIRISLIKEDKKIKIIFEDNGKGIPKNVIDKVFEPFFTTKTKNGTGLGLAIVYNIVKMHNGKISVESEESKFTRFIIEFEVKDE
jgi:two-component system NtrC family sensor kinase